MKVIDKEIIDSGNRDLNVKLNLEEDLKRKITRLMGKIASSFRFEFSRTGGFSGNSKFKDDLRLLLTEYYLTVQQEFMKDVPETNEQEKEKLLLALLLMRTNSSRESAELIEQTTTKQINESVTEARDLLIKDNEPIDQLNVAQTAFILLRRKLASRINNIVMTETQNASESTKDIVITHILDNEPGILDGNIKPKDKITKTWVTVGDDRVRPTHVIANGQKRDAKEPFIVGGEKLKHPGDRSLGASPKETANCRCSAVFSINGNIVGFHSRI